MRNAPPLQRVPPPLPPQLPLLPPPPLLLQVREAAGLPPITQMQAEAKRQALHQAANYQYSEEDVRRKVQQELQQKPVQELTTRQKLLAKHSSGGGGQQTQGPRKFQRNVLGQAVYSEE